MCLDLNHNAAVHGIGDEHARINVYMQNIPDFFYRTERSASRLPTSIMPVENGEIDACGKSCGNGWRKVFNVYAKLIYALAGSNEILAKAFALNTTLPNWQAYREQILLQAKSNTALFFNSFDDISLARRANQGIHLNIIMGKTYANSLALSGTLNWINKDFAINEAHKLIVTPYFDYRQLSNAKLLFLLELINNLLTIKAR